MVVLLVCHLQPLGFFRLGQIWENTFANKFLFLNLIRNDHKMIQNFFLIGNRFLMSSTYETFGKILLYKTKWLQITYTIQISKLTTFHFFTKNFSLKINFLASSTNDPHTKRKHLYRKLSFMHSKRSFTLMTTCLKVSWLRF